MRFLRELDDLRRRVDAREIDGDGAHAELRAIFRRQDRRQRREAVVFFVFGWAIGPAALLLAAVSVYERVWWRAAVNIVTYVVMALVAWRAVRRAPPPRG